MKKPQYPELARLGVQVNPKPCDHVLFRDLDRALSKRDRKRFSRLFGIQTCPVVVEGPACYAWDAENALARMLRGKLQGSQLVRD